MSVAAIAGAVRASTKRTAAAYFFIKSSFKTGRLIY
jgi:hypothetical protein